VRDVRLGGGVLWKESGGEKEMARDGSLRFTHYGSTLDYFYVPWLAFACLVLVLSCFERVGGDSESKFCFHCLFLWTA